jgi:alkylation response protein AidB-like acyl-CoA dehydrogenase
MEFDLDQDQKALRDEARWFLEREVGIGYARSMMEDERGFTDDVWRKVAGLGWTALPFAEEYGGLGQGFVALAILLAEMGRVVLPGPFFPTVVLAGTAIAEAGSEAQRKELLPAIAEGELLAAAVLPSSQEHASVSFRHDALHGEASFVVDGTVADRIVVATAEGLYVTNGRDGVEATPISSMDQTRKVADLRFDGAPAERLGDGGWPAVQRVLDRACVALAAEMLGGAERVLELSVEYAKQRVQFDRPIGSFQAVKHRAADMLLEVESLRSAVYYAAWALERDHPDASLAASMAKAYASDAYRKVAASGIQIHGGIGFTWEADLHLYFKRAKASEVAFGDASHHRERMAGILRERYGPTP